MAATVEAKPLLSPSGSRSPSPSPSPSTKARSPIPNLPYTRRILKPIMAALATLTLTLVILHLASAASYHGYSSAFSFDAPAAHLPAWLASLPDTTPLSSLSLPGTHDTMTHAMASPLFQCQNHDLATQLRAGVRYVDLRLRVRASQLCLFHADGFTGFCLDAVLRDMVAFLQENPSEALVVRCKLEGPPVDAPASTSFEDLFRSYIQHQDVAPHVYTAEASNSSVFPLPLLGQLRSRMLLLQDFPAAAGPAAYGPAWDGPQMALEDDWIVVDLYHLADKWVSIRNALSRAAMALSATSNQESVSPSKQPTPFSLSTRQEKPQPATDRLFLAHVSASVGVLPIAAAAGPTDLDISGLNDMTGQWLEYFGGFPDVRGVGIVIFDFPGARAIRNVVAMNTPPEKRAGVQKTAYWETHAQTRMARCAA